MDKLLHAESGWDDVLYALRHDDESILHDSGDDFGVGVIGISRGLALGLPSVKVDVGLGAVLRGAAGVAGYFLAKTIGLALLPAAGVGVATFAVATFVSQKMG